MRENKEKNIIYIIKETKYKVQEHNIKLIIFLFKIIVPIYNNKPLILIQNVSSANRIPDNVLTK